MHVLQSYTVKNFAKLRKRKFLQPTYSCLSSPCLKRDNERKNSKWGNIASVELQKSNVIVGTVSRDFQPQYV